LRTGFATVRKAGFLARPAEEIVASDGWSIAVAGVTENGLGLGYDRSAVWVDDAHVAGDHDQFGQSRFPADQLPRENWTGYLEISLHRTPPQALLMMAAFGLVNRCVPLQAEILAGPAGVASLRGPFADGQQVATTADAWGLVHLKSNPMMRAVITPDRTRTAS
jgi:hypothetical protein